MRGIDRVQEFARANGWDGVGERALFGVGRIIRSYILGRRLNIRKCFVGRNYIIRGSRCIHVGEGFQAGDGLWLEAITRYGNQVFNPRIVIGEALRASNWVHIAATNYVEIGDHCLFGSKVIITDHGHGQYSASHSSPLQAPAERQLDADRSVVIGRNVWLGDGVVVLPDVRIGDGVVVGANSVVARSLPPFTIAFGTPAIPVRRFDFTAKEWRPID